MSRTHSHVVEENPVAGVRSADSFIFWDEVPVVNCMDLVDSSKSFRRNESAAKHKREQFHTDFRVRWLSCVDTCAHSVATAKSCGNPGREPAMAVMA